MTVEFEPNSDECFSFSAPNEHFFDLLKIKKFSDVLGNPPATNDPLNVTGEQAQQLAEIRKAA